MTDVIVQVHMLGEGYDLGSLSVAAVFRPYRSLSPYIQFVGRILRLASPRSPLSPANKVYVVSHVGLNDERWWADFANFDKDDQRFFTSYLCETKETSLEEGSAKPRMTLRPFMKVLSETVSSYIQKGYLSKVDETMVEDLMNTMREKGFDPLEFGLTEELIKHRLQMAATETTRVHPTQPVAQPQKIREALRKRASSEARSIADTVINRLELPRLGKELIRFFPGKGPHNTAIVIALALGHQNAKMGIGSGERPNASKEQLRLAVDASANIVDTLTVLIRNKFGEQDAPAQEPPQEMSG